MKHLSDITDWKDCINTVVCGDSLDLMRMIPDKAIDLVLTDPPYGIKVGGAKPFGKVGGANICHPKEYLLFDDEFIPSEEYFDEIMRISKNQIIFGGNYFIEHLKNTPCFIVWDKKNSGNFADCELAWTSFKSATRIFRFMWNGMLQENMGKHKEQRFHPTQKPLELMRWCLQNYAKDCKTVIDPFAGSFTTARACKDMGFDWIAIDREEKYCQIGEKRLQQEVLF